MHLSGFIRTPGMASQVNPADRTVFQTKRGRKFKLAHRDIFESLRFGVERAQNFASGGVTVGVQNAIAAVGAFAAESELGAFSVEFGAPLDELFDAPRGIFDQHFRRLRVAQAIAGAERVLQMEADFVFVAERGGDTALRPLGVRVGDFAFGQDHDSAGRRQFDGSAQPGDSGADHQEIGFRWCGLHWGKMVSRARRQTRPLITL